MKINNFDEEKAELLREIAFVKREIYELEKEEDFKEARIFTNNYLKDSCIYKRLPISYLKTVYHLKNDEIVNLLSFSFENEMIIKLFGQIREHNKSSCIGFAVMNCSAVYRKDGGYVLQLSDPFFDLKGFVYHLPRDLKPETIANTMVQIKIVLDENVLNTHKAKLLDICPLPYWIYGTIKGNSKIELESPDYEITKSLEAVRGREKCISAGLSWAHEMVREHGMYEPSPENKEEFLNHGYIYVRGLYRQYVLVFVDDRIEAVVTEEGKLSESYQKHWYDDGIWEWQCPEGDAVKCIDVYPPLLKYIP